MKTILEFSATQDKPLEQVGSKAFALIEMTKNGYPVPPGIILTVAFFEPWNQYLHSTPEWQAVMDASVDDLGSTTKALKEICADLKFSPQQLEELYENVSLYATSSAVLFAVRSSSPEEDLESASFAGGYETTLGVPVERIEEAILHSFTSSFDERIILYKRQHGILASQPRIAVILQRQIAAETAGVAFSVNPFNNCYDEAVINANFGLGESVVSGLVEPDLFVVDKLYQTILHSKIGSKEIVIHLCADGGTVQTTRENVHLPCLSPQQVLEITDFLIRVENHYREPVDIEWAIANQQFYLLQVRPITTYLPLPDDMITAPGEEKRLYADSTLIEQGVQEPLSVLGTDFMNYILDIMIAPMGGGGAGIEGGAFASGGRYYMNLSKSLALAGPAGGLAPGSTGDESVMSILDTIDLDQYMPEKPSPLKMLQAISGPLKMLPRILPALIGVRDPERILRRYQQGLPGQLERIDNVIDENLSIHQQARNLTALLNFFFYEHGLPLVFAPQIAFSQIKKLFEEEADQVKEQLLSLGISLPGNKTAEMGAAMFALASSPTIQSQISKETFLKQLDERSLQPQFLKDWDEFVEEYGIRCPQEIDVATERPYENPGKLFEQLKNLSSGAAIFNEAKTKREAAYDLLHERALLKGKRQARSLEKSYKTWLLLGGYRETPKHYVIKIVDKFRKRVLKVAKLFLEAGRINDLNQIFDLTIADIDNALADPTLDLQALAVERVKLIDKIKRSSFVARVIDSRGKIFFPPRKPAGEGELAGTPISPGVVQGRVKILHTATEKQLLPTEILVTRSTDPGWTPLFFNASGIILEIGGALQHGAVVAREYGIPCVSGIENAMGILADGQLVEIDGTNGIVRILDGEIPYFTTSQQRGSQPPQDQYKLEGTPRVKRMKNQSLLRILPILLLPIIVLVIVIIVLIIVKILSG